MSQPNLSIIEADLSNGEHQRAIESLLVAYAKEILGDAEPLSKEVLQRLVPGLREFPTTLVLLAYIEELPVGMAICFYGFSTFVARPLINIHDFAVLEEHRGRGIGRAILEAVEHKARERGCGRLTLEVQSYNERARRIYEAAGYSHANIDHPAGGSLFYIKPLETNIA